MELPDWFISDTHFGHKNINEYCQRLTAAEPDQESVEDLMEYNWINSVKRTDTILHLGDLAFRGFDLDRLADLPGIKFFVRGNHDKHISPADLKAIGFEEIEAPTIEIEGAKLLCTHYPQSQLDSGVANVCGHVHNNPWSSTPRHINVCVELWHYAPVKGSVIAAKAAWAIMNGRVANADSGPRNVKYKGSKR